MTQPVASTDRGRVRGAETQHGYAFRGDVYKRQVLGNLQVLFVTFFAWIWLRERPRSQFLVALPVVLFGVVLLAGLASTTGPNFHPVAGVLFGFGASITYSVFILMLRANTKEFPHVAGPLADATGGAALASLVFGLALGQMRLSLIHI